MRSRDTPAARIEREILVRTSLMRIAEPGLASLVASFAEEVTFAPRTVIHRACDPAHHFYPLVHGEVEMTVEGSPPWILDSQGGLGLADVLAHRPRTATARAVSTVRAMRVAAHDYLDFLEEHFEHVMAVVLGMAKDAHDISLRLAPDGGFARGARASPGGPVTRGPMNLVQKLTVLRGAPIFRRANVQALVRLGALAREVRVEAGGSLFRRGEAAGKFVLVAGGLVEATRRDPVIIAAFGAGDLVCGYGALGAADDQFDATALSPVTAFSFTEEDFFDVMEEHFELARSVLSALTAEYERLLVESARRTGASRARGGLRDGA